MRKAKKQAEISTVHKLYVKTKSKNAGITLIALVVTIVILLILVGISIGVLTGDNGLIKNARKCKRTDRNCRRKRSIRCSNSKSNGKR